MFQISKNLTKLKHRSHLMYWGFCGEVEWAWAIRMRLKPTLRRCSWDIAYWASCIDGTFTDAARDPSDWTNTDTWRTWNIYINELLFLMLKLNPSDSTFTGTSPWSLTLVLRRFLPNHSSTYRPLFVNSILIPSNWNVMYTCGEKVPKLVNVFLNRYLAWVTLRKHEITTGAIIKRTVIIL